MKKLISSIAVCVFLISCSNAAPYKNWHEFEANELGFTIKHPPYLVLATDNTFDYKIQEISLSKKHEYVYIRKHNNTYDLTPYEWARNHPALSNINENYKTIEIDDNEAILISWEGVGKGDLSLFKTDEYIVEVGTHYLSETDLIRNDFLQIIETIEIH